MKMQYKNENITIHWDQSKCIHAGVCVKSLPNVYNPKERPWVKIENASNEELKAVSYTHLTLPTILLV